jgi:hypothetical protein
MLLACDELVPDGGDTIITEEINTGILDIAFVYYNQLIPTSRLRKVKLCLAYTADDLYLGKFFTQTNVSEAVVHYRFELPPGEYFYYASVTCFCGGDSCKTAGFLGENNIIAAGGKVTVVKGMVKGYTTAFH